MIKLILGLLCALLMYVGIAAVLVAAFSGLMVFIAVFWGFVPMVAVAGFLTKCLITTFVGTVATIIGVAFFERIMW